MLPEQCRSTSQGQIIEKKALELKEIISWRKTLAEGKEGTIKVAL